MKISSASVTLLLHLSPWSSGVDAFTSVYPRTARQTKPSVGASSKSKVDSLRRVTEPTKIRAKTTDDDGGNWWWPFSRKDVKEPTALLPNEPEAPAGGFVSELLEDLESEEVIEKETMDFLDRVGKVGAKMVKDSTERSEDEDKIDWEVKADGKTGFVPTKEMTGVEPDMCQLCSTISAQLYTKTSYDQFKLSTKDMKTELFIYDDHGAFLDTTPPFLVAITGKTMILGWRGTGSLADGLNDAAASPLSSLAWRKYAKTIKVQGAMTSIAHNDIVNHGTAIIAKAKELGITEIVTTGQSLGGGLSQIGHLTLRALIEDEKSQWNELEGVNVRSVAFCGPMTTVLLNNATPETDVFLEKLWNNSCNVVYKNDVVPRAYGYLSFIEDFVEDAESDLVKDLPIPRIAKRLLDAQGKFDELLQGAKNNESLVGLLGVFSQYRHMGNVIYYESEDAEPLVLKDMGAFHKNTKGATNLFRSIKYKPVENPMDEFMGWHMDIITAPGLSFPEDQLM